jgi:hypothetical protein
MKRDGETRVVSAALRLAKMLTQRGTILVLKRPTSG